MPMQINQSGDVSKSNKTYEKPILPNWAETLVQVLVLYSVAVYTLETHPSFEKNKFLIYSEYFIDFFFLGEFITRIKLASDKKGYLFSFFGILITT